MIPFLIYLFIGILLAFGVWIAREDEELGLIEIVTLIVIWPYFVLYTFFLSDVRLMIRQSINNKLLFVKVYMALLAITAIVLLIVGKLGR